MRSLSSDGGDWRDVKSMTDLRWTVTQSALQGEALQLMVSDREGRGSRVVQLDLRGVDAQSVDAALMKRIGLGAPFSEAVMGDVKAGGPAAAAGLRAGDRVRRVDDLRRERRERREWTEV